MITPDKDMEKYAKAKLDGKKLVLIHEKNNHFNVIVSKSDEVINNGSLSNALLDGNISSFLSKISSKEPWNQEKCKTFDKTSNELIKFK